MKLQEAIHILTLHQAWRLGTDMPMAEPKQLSEAIHVILNHHMVDETQTTSSQTEITDESWEGCDGCTEQDEVMYKNGYVKGYNSAISELLKEISDEEIEKSADYYGDRWIDAREAFYGFLEGAKWYREQLKTK